MKKLKLFSFYFLTILLLEFTFRISAYETFFDSTLIIIVLFSLAYSFLLLFINSLLGTKLNKILTYLVLSIVTLLFSAQLLVFKTFSSFFSFSGVGGDTAQILEFKDIIFELIIKNIIPILIFIVPIIIYSIFKNKLESKSRDWRISIIFILLFINLFSLTIISFDHIHKDDLYSPKKLFFNINLLEMSGYKHGIVTSFMLDINRFIFGFEEKLNIIIDDNVEELEPEIEYNILDIDWDSMIENETNKTILEMHNYFSSKTPTEKNEFTGLFKDKNLIFILAESFYPIAVNKEVNPTLHMLANTGFVFNNFYVPMYRTSTAGGEFVATTGLFPRDSGDINSLKYIINKQYPYVLGNSFKDIDYTTKSYHNHTYSYYARNKTHPSLGFDFKACWAGLNINCYLWPESDLEMVNASFNDYNDIDKFLTYYVTVSGHSKYTRVGNSMATKNWSVVKDLPFTEGIKAYLAAQHELDKALERLIELLDEEGILEDTVIVLVSDHYPYWLVDENPNNYKRLLPALDYDIDPDFDLYKNSLIIWNSEMGTIRVNKYCSNIDVLPTVYNLFGIDYDSRLFMGKDILSNSSNIIMFQNNRNWITNNGKYLNSKKTFIPNVEIEVDDDYINAINQEVFNSFYFSNKILDTEYFKYIKYNE